jgi:hypothetical protein
MSWLSALQSNLNPLSGHGGYYLGNASACLVFHYFGLSGAPSGRSRRLPTIMRPKLQKQSAYPEWHLRLKIADRNETQTLKAKRIKVC